MNYKKIKMIFLLAGITCSIFVGCKSNETKETLQEVEHYEAAAGSVGNRNDESDAKVEEDVSADQVEEDDSAQSQTPAKSPVKVKGIYVTGPKAGSTDMDSLIALVDETQINTMVIDVKNDSGEVTYKMDNAIVKEIGAEKNYIPDMESLIQKLKEKDIYLIARIVSFKDPILAEAKPEYAIKTKDGKVFRDKSGLAWVNPYDTGVWDYILEIAKEAVDLGFDEIQFDYIRFSTDSKMSEVDFGEDAKGKSKEDAITEFTKYMYKSLSPLGVFVSADVYGIVINSKIDQQIVGQNYKDMAKNLDYICPMIYPSHYADGSYGVEHPDLDPYTIVKEALSESVIVLEDNQDETMVTSEDSNENAEENTDENSGEDVTEVSNVDSDEDIKTAIVRPWLQDFTASWLPNHQTYDKEAIMQQIQAVEDAGYDEWILWNGSNHYTRLD